MKRLRKFIGLVVLMVISIVMIVFIVIPLTIDAKKSHDAKKLIKAIEKEDISEVQELLECGVDPNGLDVKPSVIWTILETSPRRPISVACNVGNLQILELLIEKGATAEPMDGCGFSPLRETLFYYQSDDLKIVQILLKNGARQYDKEYEECIIAATQMTPKVYDKNMTNGTVFISEYDEETAKAITEIVILLLEERSVNELYDGETLLACASKCGNVYLVKYLLSIGADKDLQNVHGKTALDYAYEEGHEEVRELLLRSE